MVQQYSSTTSTKFNQFALSNASKAVAKFSNKKRINLFRNIKKDIMNECKKIDNILDG